MKGILEFNLDEPFDRLAHQRAVNATNSYLALNAIGQELRQIYKYGENDTIEIEKLREMFYEILSDHNINLNDLE